MDIAGILNSLGYTLTDCGKEYRTRPIYRESGNNTSLRIKKETGNWIDFGQATGGSFEELIRITLKLSKIEDARNLLKDKYNFLFSERKTKPQITLPQTFDKSTLKNILPLHDYWVKRGISKQTLELFQGGEMHSGRLGKRYVFPIFNSQWELAGFAGRDLTDKAKSKWKFIGAKTHWRYPLQYNRQILKESSEIILVESIGDGLSLWECGIKNFIVLFGVEMSLSVLNTLLKIDPDKIVIALNNEPNNASIGNDASKKIEGRLLKHFDKKQVKIYLPVKKDFNEMLQDSSKTINQWYEKINI